MRHGCRYEPDFLIRGLSLDTHRGIVCKLTFLHTITPSESTASARRGGSLGNVACTAFVSRGASSAAGPPPLRVRRIAYCCAGTAFFGRRCLSTAEVTRIYGGLHVSTPELVRGGIATYETLLVVA